MGGRGSGRSAGLGLTVDKTSDFHSIDLGWLRRRSLLNGGFWSTITWSRGGNPTGSVRVMCQSNGLRISYRARQHGQDWVDVDELVPFAGTATQFGGNRQWFTCLSCRLRCRILYGGSYFRCRRCCRLKYDTQYEPDFARAATQALKIRERLGGQGGIDDAFPPKPKGMHWRTYERLRAKAERLEGLWGAGIMGRFGPFDRLLE